MFIVSTNNNGHYQSYREIFERNSSASLFYVSFDGKGSLINLFILAGRVLASGHKDRRILFLNGEEVFLPIFFKLLMPVYDVKSIVYYAFLGSSFKSFLKRVLLCLSSFLRISIYFLEGGDFISRSRCLFKTKYFPLNDPIILYSISDNSCDKSVRPTLTSDNKFTFLVAGYIDERKNIRKIIDALDDLQNDRSCAFELILLGCQSIDVQNYVQEYLDEVGRLKITSINRRFTDDEYLHYTEISDVVLAIYENHLGSSGVVLNAVYCNKPVLFIPIGVCASYMKALSIKGLPINSDESEIARAISYVIDNVEQYSSFDRSQFMLDHSQSVFVEKLLG